MSAQKAVGEFIGHFLGANATQPFTSSCGRYNVQVVNVKSGIPTKFYLVYEGGEQRLVTYIPGMCFALQGQAGGLAEMFDPTSRRYTTNTPYSKGQQVYKYSVSRLTGGIPGFLYHLDKALQEDYVRYN